MYSVNASAKSCVFTGGKTGGTSIYYANAISTLAKQAGLKFLVNSSGGAIEQIRLVNSGKSHFSLVYSGQLFAAERGQLKADPKKYNDIRVMAYCYGAPYVMVFLLYPSKEKWLRILDYPLILLSVIACGYWILNFEALLYRAGIETQTDKIISIIGVILSVEIARRVIGNIFVILGVIFLAFGIFGPYVPEPFTHPGSGFLDMCTIIFLKSDGVFGIVASAIATYIFLFVLFGTFLEKSGAYSFFIDFPIAAVGHKTGGPAKVSVISSGLFGSISGSAIANTVSTGAFTIPLMKKAGFRPHIAGAIEPAASIGGMFMPPIMGAGAFIMAELTGVPYVKIMLISIFPALMYFFSVFVMVHYEAEMHNIKGIKSDRGAMEILKKEGHFILPLIIIVIAMLLGFSAGFSAVAGIISCIAISWVKKSTRMGLKEIVNAACAGA